MRIAVTGATGFIGQYVVAELLKHGHEVVAMGSSCRKTDEMPWGHNVVYVALDLHGEYKTPFEALHRPDVVIHLAWKGLPNYQKMFHLEENLFHQYRFLKGLIDGGLAHLVVAGTCLEYGMRNGPLSEDLKVMPDNPYAIAKYTLFQMMELLRKKNLFVMQWVRIFYLYGKGQNPNSLFSQLERAVERGDADFPMSGGEQLRDFLPVGEVARRLAVIAAQKKVTGIINCCSGTPISVRRQVEERLAAQGHCMRLLLGAYPYLDFEPMAFWGDSKKFDSIQ